MNDPVKCAVCEVGFCALNTLNEKEIQRLEDSSCQVEYREGELVLKQETPIDNVVYLRKGYVKEYLSHQNMPDQVIQLLKPKTYINLQGACANTFGFFSYRAITDVELCLIDRNVFTELVKGNGMFAREILRASSNESLSNQKRFLALNQTQLFGKVAGLIQYLSGQVYESDTFQSHLTREELGQMIASTRESVTRALKWFEKEGVIIMDKDTISITNRKRLDEMAIRG